MNLKVNCGLQVVYNGSIRYNTTGVTQLALNWQFLTKVGGRGYYEEKRGRRDWSLRKGAFESTWHMNPIKPGLGNEKLFPAHLPSDSGIKLPIK